MARSVQEMFVCVRAGCVENLSSASALERHVMETHVTKTDPAVWQDFEFEPVAGQQDSLLDTTGRSIEENFEFEGDGPLGPHPLVLPGKRKEEGKRQIRTKMKSDYQNLAVRIDREHSNESAKDQKIKRITSVLPTIKKFIVKTKSSFTLEEIEKRQENFTDEAKKEFETLIDEGRDEEIYYKMFGDLSRKRKRNWICVFHQNKIFYGDKRKFESHFLEEHQEKVTYNCELCPRSTKNIFKFEHHLKDAHFLESQCQSCNISFSSNTKLLTHKLKVHDEGARLVCHLCDRKFVTRIRLQGHQANAHSNQKFPCLICAKYFKSKAIVQQHEKIHLKQTNKQTPQQMMKRAETEARREARRVQARERREKTCDECGRCFKVTGKFNEHKKFHQRDESLICTKCARLYTSRYALMTHVKNVHEGIKDFSCEKCNFKACNTWKLSLHTRKVHLNEVLTCSLCEKRVKHEYQHVTSMHKAEMSWKDYIQMKGRKEFEAPPTSM